MKNSTKTRALLMAALLSVGGGAFAQSASDEGGYCDPQVAQALVQEYKARQSDRDETLNPLLKKVNDVAEDSFGQLSSCVDLSWPTLSITYPTMDMIIRGIAKQLVNKACGAARETITKANSAINGSFYMNTRLPGVPSAGVSTYGSTGALPPITGPQQILPPTAPTH